MTRNYDPDRIIPAETFEHSDPMDLDLSLDVCHVCSATFPAIIHHAKKHWDYHVRLSAMLTQLSGSDPRSPTGPSDPDPMSGAASSGPERDARAEGSAAPDTTGPPLNEAEFRETFYRQAERWVTKQAGATSPGGATTPPEDATSLVSSGGDETVVSRVEMLTAWEPLAESAPPELGGTERAGGDESGGPGKLEADVPAGTDPDETEQAKFDLERADEREPE